MQGPTHADGCDDVDKNCHGVQSYCVKKKDCFYGYDSAYAFAMNFSNPIFRGGAARSRYTQCMDYAAGKINMFELSRHSIKPIRIRLSGISDALIESRFSCDTVTFNEDSNSVTLHNLWGFIKVDSDDPESYFSVAMLRIQEALADSIEDGAPTIYWHGKAMLFGNNLVKEGEFSGLTFVVTPLSGGGKLVEFNWGDITIPLSSSIDLEEIEVNISGDCGRLEDGISSRFMLSDEQLTYFKPSSVGFDFTLFPNPTVTDITINFNKNAKNISISVYNTDMQIISKLYQGSIVKNKPLSLPTSNLKSGVYYICVDEKEYRYIRKLIKK